MNLSALMYCICESNPLRTGVVLHLAGSPLFWIYACSHFWFATVHEVLQADWQDVWHSPQPRFAVSFKLALFKV